MKPLSETYKELGIAFSFPIEIKNVIGDMTYFEGSNGYWERCEYNALGNVTYSEDSEGVEQGTPRSAKTCEGKVIEVDGIKYELRSL